jgi:hypothetical protein
MKYFYSFQGLGLSWIRVKLCRDMERTHDDRAKQIAVGAAILIGLMLIVSGALLGWRYLPSILGEWVGSMIGIMTTPFFLEASFLAIGLLIVISLNIWRRHKEGDELVYLEHVTGPGIPENLPDQAKWVIYREAPLEATAPTPIEQAEGALSIADFASVQEWLASLESGELSQPKVLEIRLKLAEATGREDLASDLKQKIHNAKP